MSTSTNVHTNYTDGCAGSIRIEHANLTDDDWPVVIRIEYKDGCNQVGNHATTFFIDGLDAQAIRTLAGDMNDLVEGLFARARQLEGKE